MGLEEMLALLATGDVYIPELDVKKEVKEDVMEEAMEDRPPTPVWNGGMYELSWSWTTTVPCILLLSLSPAPRVARAPWSPPPPHPPCSTYRGHRASLGDAMTFLGPPSHLWTPPTYIDLTKDDDGEDGGA